MRELARGEEGTAVTQGRWSCPLLCDCSILVFLLGLHDRSLSSTFLPLYPAPNSSHLFYHLHCPAHISHWLFYQNVSPLVCPPFHLPLPFHSPCVCLAHPFFSSKFLLPPVLHPGHVILEDGDMEEYSVCVCVSVCLCVTQSCPTLCDPMDCSPPGSSVHGILQARILEWLAIPFSRGSSQPRDQTQVSCIAGGFFTV